jgi:hypothetical protein
VARTYRTLSLSLHPKVVAELDRRGKRTNITAARMAAEIVLREIAKDNVDCEYRRRVAELAELKKQIAKAIDDYESALRP